MVINEKTKFGILAIILVALTVVVINYQGKSRIVNLIYFRRESCIIVKSTDRIMKELEENFGEDLKIRTIDLDDEKLSNNDKRLIQEHDIIGVPVILINGKEYTEEFTKDEIEKSICKNFLIKPEECK
jgi:glutaredoxin